MTSEGMMGCDIHVHIEVKNNDKWEHYSLPHIERHYELFAKMADVRNFNGIKPISEPKGLPDDLSIVTQIDVDRWGEDAHSHSWFGPEELVKLRDWYGSDMEMTKEFGYVFGSYLSDFIEYRGEYPKEVQDLRIVFWFDN